MGALLTLKPALQQGLRICIKTSLDQVGWISSQHQSALNRGLEAASLEHVQPQNDMHSEHDIVQFIRKFVTAVELLCVQSIVEKDPSSGCMATLWSSK